jgi:hypothetical protein
VYNHENSIFCKETGKMKIGVIVFCMALAIVCGSCKAKPKQSDGPVTENRQMSGELPKAAEETKTNAGANGGEVKASVNAVADTASAVRDNTAKAVVESITAVELDANTAAEANAMKAAAEAKATALQTETAASVEALKADTEARATAMQEDAAADAEALKNKIDSNETLNAARSQAQNAFDRF